jgi:predicted transcriptional regulator
MDFMYHTQHVLFAYYKSATAAEIVLLKVMQIFMYALFEDILKTKKAKLVVSNYRSTRDDQCNIYKELTEQATTSSFVQHPCDTFLSYITSAQYRGYLGTRCSKNH